MFTFSAVNAVCFMFYFVPVVKYQLYINYV